MTVPALPGWTPVAGDFRLVPGSRVLIAPQPAGAASDEAETFADDAAEIIARRLPVVSAAGNANSGDILLRLDGNRVDLGEEGYALAVGEAVTVTAKTDAGVFYGTRTLLQMFRSGGTVPAGSVVDVPRYAERGVGVCACVAHISVEWLQRLVRDASYLKLNQLWLELKIKSDTHPETVSWGYYTKPEVAALQALAARYHVTLVPEIDAPGHLGPWLSGRPDLQLTAEDGTPNTNNLDITNPAAFGFVTDLIDEYLTLFDTPFWHLGADEYLLGDDYAKYPGLLAYAQQRYGPQAVAQDAFIDFVNRVNAYVTSKGKRLRIWNDGLTGQETVPLDTDIVVEHWRADRVRPSTLLARGQALMNAASSLYDVRGSTKVDVAGLYARDWSPLMFEGETVRPSPGVTGAKITLWADDGSAETENEIEAQLVLPLRFIAQATWGPTRPDPGFAAFTRRANAVGRAPGLALTGPAPAPQGPVTLAAGGGYLAPSGPDPGATITVTGLPAEWRLERTPDGYYTIRHDATGRCAEPRLGARELNIPLEPDTPVTAEPCSPTNRLQRWQLAASEDTITLTNAITRMVAALTGSGVLVQQVPDGHPPARLTAAG
jgi:hexosaminidase